MRRIFVFYSIFFMLLTVCLAGYSITLDEIISISITNNPEIKSLLFEIYSSEKRRDSLSSLDNPYGIYEFGGTSENMEKMFGLRIPLSFHKKILSYGVYDSDITTKRLFLEKRVLEITNSIRKMYYKNSLLYVIKKEYDSLIEVLEGVERVVNSRYLSGTGSQKDVIVVKTEIAKIGLELDKLAYEIRKNEIQILSLAGISLEMSNFSYDYSVVSNIIYSVFSTNIGYEDITNYIDFKISDSQVNFRKKMYEYSFIESLPEIMLTLKSDFMNNYAIMLEMEIPLFFGKNVNMVSSEYFMYISETEKKTSVAITILSTLKSLYLKGMYQKKILSSFYDNVILQLKTSIDISTSEYLSGKSSVYEIIESIKLYTQNVVEYYKIIDELIDTIFDIYNYGARLD